MSHKKLKQIGAVPSSVSDPVLKSFLQAVKENIESMNGLGGKDHKRPSIQEMIDAGIPNADKLK